MLKWKIIKIIKTLVTVLSPDPTVALALITLFSASDQSLKQESYFDFFYKNNNSGQKYKCILHIIYYKDNLEPFAALPVAN